MRSTGFASTARPPATSAIATVASLSPAYAAAADHDATVIRIGDRIGDDVAHDALEQQCIAHHGQRALGSLAAPRKPRVLRRRGESPRAELLPGRQGGGPLEGQRCGGEAASLPCALRGLLELLADRGVGLAGRRRAVPGAAIGLGLPVEHARQRAMGSLPLRQRRGLVDGGAHERVAKLEPRAAHVHQACLLGVIERVRRRAEVCGGA